VGVKVAVLEGGGAGGVVGLSFLLQDWRAAARIAAKARVTIERRTKRFMNNLRGRCKA